MNKFFSVVASLLVACTGSLQAQEVGTWDIYPVFSESQISQVIDTDDNVYYLSCGWLYSYDKSSDETVYHTNMNGMSDTGISFVRYNYEKKYLMVVYTNSNIDIVRANGEVDNIPDLKDVVVTMSKTINSVDFDGDTAYLATNFGYIVVDCDKCVIKESYNYGKQFYSMVAVGDYLYANFDSAIYVSEKSATHYKIDSFRATNFAQQAELYKTDDKGFFVKTGWLYYFRLGSTPEQPEIITTLEAEVKNLSQTKDEALVASYASHYSIVSTDGGVTTVDVPSAYEGSYLSTYDGKQLWNLDSNGITCFTIAGGDVQIVHDSYVPNTTSVNTPHYLIYKNNRLYTMNSGTDFLFWSPEKVFEMATLKDGRWRNEVPTNVKTFNSNSKGVFFWPYSLTVDPDDPEAIWYGSWFEGMACAKGNEEIQRFTPENAPIIYNYIAAVPALTIDSQKNLWIAPLPYKSEATAPRIFVLPAAKRFSKDVTVSDWTSYDLSDMTVSSRMARLLITKNDRYVLFADNNWKSKLLILEPNGTPLNQSDDRHVVINSYTDQDGKILDVGYIHCMKEDSEGRIWLGTNAGIMTLTSTNIQNALSGNINFNRIKVPRNDGTNLADYLADGLTVTCIDIDGAGRKWIGTSTSGLYLVSSDGTEIIQHFNKDNSALTSDNILSVACSTDDNSVFVGTESGTLVYKSDASPSADDYSDVYAYPNPVRPEYTGYITIAGLMDNSLVKIADAMGNVVYSGRSTGGMLSWSGCNSDGQRVNTGVYYVFASQNENEQSSGCVTKILVVK